MPSSLALVEPPVLVYSYCHPNAYMFRPLSALFCHRLPTPSLLHAPHYEVLLPFNLY